MFTSKYLKFTDKLPNYYSDHLPVTRHPYSSYYKRQIPKYISYKRSFPTTFIETNSTKPFPATPPNRNNHPLNEKKHNQTKLSTHSKKENTLRSSWICRIERRIRYLRTRWNEPRRYQFGYRRLLRLVTAKITTKLKDEKQKGAPPYKGMGKWENRKTGEGRRDKAPREITGRTFA